jgi:hypothetical protein
MLIYGNLSIPIRMYVNMPASCSRNGRDSVFSAWLAPGRVSGDHTRLEISLQLSSYVITSSSVHPRYVLAWLRWIKSNGHSYLLHACLQKGVSVRIPTKKNRTDVQQYHVNKSNRAHAYLLRA